MRFLTLNVVQESGAAPIEAVWRQFLWVSGVGIGFFVYSLQLFRKSIAVTK